MAKTLDKTIYKRCDCGSWLFRVGTRDNKLILVCTACKAEQLVLEMVTG